jgi:hypothetical protein
VLEHLVGTLRKVYILYIVYLFILFCHL